MPEQTPQPQTSDYVFRVVAILITWLILAGVVHLAFVYVAPMAEGQKPPAFWENYALVAILWTVLRWWKLRRAKRAALAKSGDEK